MYYLATPFQLTFVMMSVCIAKESVTYISLEGQAKSRRFAPFVLRDWRAWIHLLGAASGVL